MSVWPIQSLTHSPFSVTESDLSFNPISKPLLLLLLPIKLLSLLCLLFLSNMWSPQPFTHHHLLHFQSFGSCCCCCLFLCLDPSILILYSILILGSFSFSDLDLFLLPTTHYASTHCLHQWWLLSTFWWRFEYPIIRWDFLMRNFDFSGLKINKNLFFCFWASVFGFLFVVKSEVRLLWLFVCWGCLKNGTWVLDCEFGVRSVWIGRL